MCRSIRTLSNLQPPASDEELHEAALQYVRKLAGTRKPSRANEEAFERAVASVEATTRELLASLVATTPPRDRETLRLRAAERDAGRIRYQGQHRPSD